MAERKLLMTPQITGVYLDLFEARTRRDAKPGDKPKFSAVFLFTPAQFEDPLTKAIRAEVEQAALDKWGETVFRRMVEEGTFENPFRRDVGSKGYPSEFHRYFNSSANADYPPGVFGREIDPEAPKDKPRPKRLTDPRAFYHGVQLRVSVMARAYGGPGTTYKPGVKLDMRNVQWMADGPRIELGGGTGGSEFDALPSTPAAPLSGASMLD